MIEKYVVSLDLAKKLKEAGWEKVTTFQWGIDTTTSDVTLIKINRLYPGEARIHKRIKYPAPLAEEILEELPKYIHEYVECEGKTYYLTAEINEIGYRVGYRTEPICLCDQIEWLYLSAPYDKLSDAAARTWLWLKEDGYLE